MEWPKLKNIILLILAITNAFLLYFVVEEARLDRRQRENTRSNVISFLNENGIALQEEQVPEEISALPQLVERDLTAEKAAAAAILGDDAAVEARGSEVYRYQNETGWIQFHSDGSFSAQFREEAFPLAESREKTGQELLARLSYDSELLRQAEETVSFRLLWEGLPVFNQQVTLVYGEHGVVGITAGKRLTGQPRTDRSREPMTTATALVAFYNGLDGLGDVCSRIDGIRQGYVAAADLSGTMVMTPVWYVATDTGAYQLNLLNGVLSRVAA